MRSRTEVMLVLYRCLTPSPRQAGPASTSSGPEFLVLLRSPKDHGYWHLVAGGVEDGEAPDAAALRELEEETGLPQPVGFAPIPLDLSYRNVVTDVWVTLHSYSAEVAPGWEPVLNHEHVDYRWCSEDEAVALLEYPEPRDALRWVARQLEAKP